MVQVAHVTLPLREAIEESQCTGSRSDRHLPFLTQLVPL